MKVIGINGSPRKKWNTATLIEEALRGAESAGATTELINLYSQEFRGCMSCFACKRKGSKTEGLCAIRDSLRPILAKALEADAIVIGAPIYYSYPSAYFRAFMERFLFPLDPYMVGDNGERVKFLEKVIPTGIIFTMNCPKKYWDQYHYREILDSNGDEFGRITGYAESYYSDDTYQFTDYSKYDANYFDEQEKRIHRETQFPIDRQNCFEMGSRLVAKATELNL